MQIEDLNPFIGTVLGSSRHVTGIDRLTGGTKKGVYRLTLDDSSSFVLYVWNDDESYWPESGTDADDPFADANGADLFASAYAQLRRLGVRTPEMFVLDRSRAHHPADLALLEDFPGGTLEAMIEADPQRAPVAEFGAMLAAMNAHTDPRIGKVARVEDGTAPQNRRPEQVVLDQALRHLGLVSVRVPAIAAAQERVEDTLLGMAAAIEPRSEFALIHGELGADHVMLDRTGRPGLIDIEGLMFFDIEWEQHFTEMRFGDAYPRLGVTAPLDPARMRFYELARSLSLVEGPLRILDSDFPDRAFMEGIAAWHTAKTLRLSGCAD
jgi:hypothetical protein